MNRRGVLAALLFTWSTPAFAWGKPRYRVNLLGGELRKGIWLAGLDIEMEKDWKTYWRVPGDAGIPPDFGWSRSINVKNVEVRWPAPRRYHDAAGETIGYKTRVVFPLLVTPADPGEPVTLALDAFFAVCKDVCIPATAKVSLQLEPDPAAANLIAAYDARVPVPGDAIASARLTGEGGGPGLLLTMKRNLPEDADIFVEGFDAAYFRAPRKQDDGYLLPIDGLKTPDALRGKTLKLTLVAQDMQLEQSLAVD